MSAFTDRRKRLTAWMEAEGLAAVYLTRDPDVRYLTGMPADSVFLLFASGRSVLLPWDINLARRLADADEIIPYTDYDRNLNRALAALLAGAGIGTGHRIEIPGDTSYPAVATLAKELPGPELVCRSDGLDDAVRKLRAVKDAGEIATIERAAAITDEIVDELVSRIENNELHTELDIALFLERGARARGAEGTGFEPLVAGPSRSNGIHAFPSYTAAPFVARGCGIIDFGVKYDGYTSDITLTAVFGEPTPIQSTMLALVQRAYDEAVALALPGADGGDIARHVDSIFAEAGYTMPHSLGHGVGLQVHEAPWLRSKSTTPAPLEPGMVFTIEPGLYHPTEGGVRLENDILLTGHRARTITRSRIVRFPDRG